MYSQIAMRLKADAPASKTLMVTLANGSAGSGYIYADNAYSHLTFQVKDECLSSAQSDFASGRILMLRHLITSGWLVLIPASGLASTSRWLRPWICRPMNPRGCVL